MKGQTRKEKSFDNAELIQARKKVAEMEALKASILEAIPNAVIGLQDRQIIFVNDGVKSVFGWTSEELIGKSTRLLYRSEQDYIRIAGLIYSILETHPSVSIDFPCVRKDGTFIECMVRAARIGTQLKERQVVITYENITDRKRAERELEHSQRQLRKLSAHLQSIYEKERARIARELHDELGQLLTALNTEIVMLKNKIPARQKTLAERTERMSSLVDLTMQSVKQIYMGLRPGMLDHLGLTAAISWQAQEFSKRTGIPCTVSFSHEEITLDPDLTTTIFRIFQEALTNVHRHAEATKVTGSLKVTDDNLEFVVKDNGKGIVERQMRKADSFGLLGIQERVYHWGGQVAIVGKKGRGTALSIVIPLRKTGTAS
ncbi:MAG: PAS domain-containing sensor histidine kinase [Spirochaetes bacterium]|nr:MAG: PAS domain-containing sensor histidine kinase [Spirochaetota bacterium]